jgi:hypothetical protein
MKKLANIILASSLLLISYASQAKCWQHTITKKVGHHRYIRHVMRDCDYHLHWHNHSRKHCHHNCYPKFKITFK